MEVPVKVGNMSAGSEMCILYFFLMFQILEIKPTLYHGLHIQRYTLYPSSYYVFQNTDGERFWHAFSFFLFLSFDNFFLQASLISN